MWTKGHRSVLEICCGLVLACLVFPGDCYAEMFSIDFEDLAVGESLDDQYAGWGVYFRGGLSQSAEPPDGYVIGGGYGGSSQAYRPVSGSSGFYILFDDPITWLRAHVYEMGEILLPPDEPEPNPDPTDGLPPADDNKPCVYMKLFSLDGEGGFSLLEEVGPVHTPSEWTEMSFVSATGVGGLWVYNLHYATFAVDDLRFGSTGDFAVPVPGSLLLVFAAVPPIVAARRRLFGRVGAR